MKTKGLKKNKINIITLGCSKNTVDSEVLLTQLKANQLNAAHESEEKDANIIIVNTCGFIDRAKEESINTILEYAEAKAENRIDKLFVTGCLSQRYKDDLTLEIPEVDAWFGTIELPLLLRKFNADYKHELLGERITTTATHYSYLKIAEGCDRPCSFCAIPLMRGKHISRPIESLVQEAQNLAKNGTRELILIAQDLTYYGLDLYKKRELPELLRRLSDISGIEWIRLQYAYPSGFPLETLDVMNERSNICKYLDMPLQHGSTAMLQYMRRGITREKTEILIDKIRQKVPDISLRTTLIAGHPHETEKDFEEMVEFVEKTRFERLGIFEYSHEENTHSFLMPDNVSPEIKAQRANQIMEIQQGINWELNQDKIGKIYKVLFDRKEGNYFIGRTEFDSPEVDNEVLVDAQNSDNFVRLGDFANVKITNAGDFDLFGNIVI